MFDSFVIVDWSAASQPKTGRDSIWICAVDRDGVERLVENPQTRHNAKNLLRELLSDAMARGERVLLGFDFPFGYPAGFAQRLGLNHAPPWRAVWDEIAARLKDAENNSNDRFTMAAEFNRRVSNRAFPFWGCPVRFTDDFLGPKHHNGHAADGLAEKRLIDRWMVGAQPCWKLAYTGSVGSQSLTGIPVVRALRDDPRWAQRARIWPFETGLAVPDAAQIVFAEVWPSWWRGDIRGDYGPPNDKAQVRTVARIFASADGTGALPMWFVGDPDLTAEQRRVVETEEAWTLGVTRARQRAAPAPTPTLPRLRGRGAPCVNRADETLPRKRGREDRRASGGRVGALGGQDRLRIAVPLLPRIANFDDLDPLRAEPAVELVLVRPGQPLPRDAALVILPGSKATLSDLAFLRHQGWDIDLLAHHRHGGHILGICGGYQMLGRRIADPEGIEGAPGEAAGLGLLDIATVLGGDKRLAEATGRDVATGMPVRG
jgi:CobB/CobQ-like glutamine amidotransferase domain